MEGTSHVLGGSIVWQISRLNRHLETISEEWTLQKDLVSKRRPDEDEDEDLRREEMRRDLMQLKKQMSSL